MRNTNKKRIEISQTNSSEINWISDKKGIYTDIRDEKKYKIVKIGKQIWFAENLAFKTDSGCCFYNNDSANLKRYGYLYHWFPAKKACPAGWHLATNEQWNNMINHLGGKSVAGIELKTVEGWNKSFYSSSNSSGFSGIPSGKMTPNGSFEHEGDDALFWSSTEKNNKVKWKVRLSKHFDSVSTETCFHLNSLSVRCIKD